MDRVLVTGFEPFGGYDVNPTQEIAEKMNGTRIGNAEIIGEVLPCTYYGWFEAAKKVIEKIQPQIIIHLWLTSSAQGVRIEQIARNIKDSKYVDADWVEGRGAKIVEDERVQRFMNSQWTKIHSILQANKIPVELFIDAESFICNSLMYLMCQYISEQKLNIKNTFLHIPWTDDHKNMIKWSLEKMTIPKQQVTRAVESIIIERRDI